MRLRTSTALVLAALAAVPAASYATAPAPTAEARLSASQLNVGEPASLSVTVADEATPPDVKIANARVRFAGQSQQTTIVNGVAHQAQTFVYRVVPTAPGALDVPALPVATSHGVAMTAPIHATVAATTAAGTPTGAAAGATASTTAGAAAGTTAGTTASASAPTRADGAHAMLRVELPAKKLWVGQAVPVTIRAYFRAGTAATLDGQPAVTSDAFTLSQLSDKPAQHEVELRGERWLEAVWTGVLSPAKAVHGAVGVKLPVELAYRERVQRPHRTLRDVFGDDPFADDPFASQFFDQEDAFADMFDEGALEQRHVDLEASAGNVIVAEPPAAGRPAGFAGAVGSFALTMDAPADGARVGEPVTLTMRVTGSGNFDRVNVAGVPEGDGLKTYGVKATVQPDGSKVFEQTIVPTRAGAVTLPGVELAYFDPAAKQYRVAKTQPVTLQVAPGAATAGLDATAAPDMAPNETMPGALHASLVPLVLRPEAWAVPGFALLVALALAGAGVWRRSSVRRARARQAEVDRAVGEAREVMRAAARRGDAPAFFAAARAAVQRRLGAAWGIAPEAVTPADVAARLHDDELIALLEHADRITYAGNAASEPLDRWLALADRQLAHLEAA